VSDSCFIIIKDLELFFTSQSEYWNDTKRFLTKGNVMRTQQILEVIDVGLAFLLSAERPCSTLSLRFICLALELSVTVV
jgi:hypothetical protein